MAKILNIAKESGKSNLGSSFIYSQNEKQLHKVLINKIRIQIQIIEDGIRIYIDILWSYLIYANPKPNTEKGIIKATKIK